MVALTQLTLGSFIMGKIFLFLIGLLCGHIQAIEIIALAGEEGGFQIPQGSYFTNSSPRINERGDVSFKVNVFENSESQGVLISRKGEGHRETFLFQSGQDHYFSDPSLNDHGEVVVSEYSMGQHYGVFKMHWSQSERRYVRKIILPMGGIHINSKYRSPQINNRHEITYIAKHLDGNHSLQVFRHQGQTDILLKEKENELSYLFNPQINDRGHVSVKVRLQNQQEKIVFLGKERKEFFFDDYRRIDNSHTLLNDGSLLVLGEKKQERKLCLIKVEKEIRDLICEKEGELNRLISFSAYEGRPGEVFFRGINHSGVFAIYRLKEGKVEQLLAGGDTIRLYYKGEEKEFEVHQDGSFPPFGGNIGVNSQSQMVVNLHIRESDSGRKYRAVLLFHY